MKSNTSKEKYLEKQARILVDLNAGEVDAHIMLIGGSKGLDMSMMGGTTNCLALLTFLLPQLCEELGVDVSEACEMALDAAKSTAKYNEMGAADNVIQGDFKP